jgi:predicted O-linked N-acetylglucosamine transferase (SPINDLY family)
MDLFLDTSPYNAGATASDALWAGLPVLTCLGQSFASRYAASLLRAVDLPELVTTTRKDYEDLAVRLATEPKELASKRRRLERNRAVVPLFNTPLFTRNLEYAFTRIYERWCASLPPSDIYPGN